MATQSITHAVDGAGASLTRSKSYSGTLVTRIDGETVADAQTDKQITVTLDVPAVKSFYLVSDKSVTVEINNSAGVGGSISLVAGVPYVWTTDSYDTFKFATDWTAIFVTNASGATATLYMEALVDATP